MKAIIMERRGEYAAVLCEDGTFVKTRASGEVGETIELTAETVAFQKKKKKAWMRNAVAAVLALTLTGGTLGYMGNTASAYVSLDVGEDSAIELTVNHFGRVIAVDALDDNARDFAKSLSGEIRHHRAEDAFHITMERLHDRGYFGEPGGALIIGVTSDNERRAAELRGFAERSMGYEEENGFYVFEMSRAERDRAMEQHVSAGRFGYERDHKNEPLPWQGQPPMGGGQPPMGGGQPPMGGGQPPMTGGPNG